MSETDLWRAYQRNRSRDARNALVVFYEPLACAVARTLANRLPRHVELAELVAMGLIGLIEAVERFDPDAGNQFATFANWRIRGAMLDGMRAIDGASRPQRRRARELGEITEALSQLHCRSVSAEEASRMIGLPPSAPPPKTVSWDDVSSHQGPIVLGSEERTELELLMNDKTLLSEPERTTLFMSYFADYSLAEIGAALGFTESRACQVRKAALAKLRRALEWSSRQDSIACTSR